jgi:AcrR family transcriptional regulator
MGIQERKEREKERRKQQIIVAAKRVFTDKGFSGATMDDIAKAAELSPGTLYLYFKNKDELFASLSLRILQYMLLRLEQLHTSGSMDPAEKIAALTVAMFDVYDFDPLMIINLLHLQSSETLKNLSEELFNEIEQLHQKSMDSIALIFQDGVRQGVFIDKEPDILTGIFWSIFSGVILWESSKSFLETDQNRIKDALRPAFESFIRGIKK